MVPLREPNGDRLEQWYILARRLIHKRLKEIDETVMFDLRRAFFA